ncbi:MAG: dihydrofolate reductase [Bacteroides sp.]|jgi:dihydrofolate reductase|nr:dihydrofolate reductase [Bacteroides sp.]
MKITLIAAVANNHVIGADNRLLWHLPADLQHFKKLTIGHTMVMGRKTFESIGKPLPGRHTIVITRKKDYDAAGCEIAHSLEKAFKLVGKREEVFVVGGAEIYQQTIDLPQTHTLYITRVFASFEGDAFFPDVDPNQWQLIERLDRKADEKNIYDMTFLTYKRKK